MVTQGYTGRPPEAGSLRRWIPVLVWMVVIAAATSLPPGPLGEIVRGGLDRVVHAAVYAVLAALVARAIAAEQAGEDAVAAGTLIATLAFGGLMEWIQGFVGRSPDVLDWAADGAGVLTALAARGVRLVHMERPR